MKNRIFLLIFFILVAHLPGKPFNINNEDDERTVNPDGEIYIFDSEGSQKGMIHIPGFPNTIAFGKNDRNTLFVTGREAFCSVTCPSQPEYKVLVLTERGGQHENFAAAALKWLDRYASDNNLEITVINNTNAIDEDYLRNFKVFIQLDYPPYNWSEKAIPAFVRYIEEGLGGWIGFHHATLLGEFDGYPMWIWFSGFMGSIRFDNYIAEKASARVNVEDPGHPVMQGVSSSFVLDNDEWYTFNKSPRPNVKVLATVDESTYDPPSDIKMGDHPVVWVNEKMKARNAYFLMGHDQSLFDSNDFTRMFANAVRWASGN